MKCIINIYGKLKNMNIKDLLKELGENFKEIDKNNENEVIDFIIRPILETTLENKGLKYKPHYVKRNNQSGSRNCNPDFLLRRNGSYTMMIEAKNLNETFNIENSEGILYFNEQKQKYKNKNGDIFGQLHLYLLYAEKELRKKISVGILTNGKDWIFIKSEDFCDYNNLENLLNPSMKSPELSPKPGWKEKIEQLSIYQNEKIDEDKLSELINKLQRLFSKKSN